MSNRIETAIEFLKDGQSFTVDGLKLGIKNNYLYITGWSRYTSVEILTKKNAIKELEEVKSLFNGMLENSIALNDFARDKKLKYNLAFNYGMGSVPICIESEGKINWETELKD